MLRPGLVPCLPLLFISGACSQGPQTEGPLDNPQNLGGSAGTAVTQPATETPEVGTAGDSVGGGGSSSMDAAGGLGESPDEPETPALPSGIISTVLGTGSPANNGDEGAADAFNVGQPFGVEVGPDGSLYVTEVENHRVLRVDLENQSVQSVAGTGESGYSGDGGPATTAKLNEPYEVRFDADGNMYFVEMRNHVVRRVDAETQQISTIAGTGAPGYSGDNGLAVDAQLNQPHSIALDAAGGLYIADIGNHRIRRVDLGSGQIESIAGSAQPALPSEGQIAKGGPILGPRALSFSDGTLWIALREGHSVWRLPLAQGTLHHVAGDGQQGFLGDGGSAKTARFNGPKGIAVGPNGDVYVVDTENQAIRRIDVAQDRITTIAGSGPDGRGSAGDGEDATRAELDRPHGIAVAADGTVFIGDTNNHRVRRVTP